MVFIIVKLNIINKVKLINTSEIDVLVLVYNDFDKEEIEQNFTLEGLLVQSLKRKFKYLILLLF